MNVIEIFSSIEGEGSRQGFLATFVRLYDCNVRCSYCDTTYSYGPDADFESLPIEALADRIEEEGNPRVTITGGEPLLQEGDLWALIDELNRRSALEQGLEPGSPEANAEVSLYEFNIETNGTLVPKTRRSNTFFTFDYKGPSSLVEDQMDMAIVDLMTDYDLFKFVVGSQEDLDAMRRILTDYEIPAQIYVSPIWGQIDAKTIVDYLKVYNFQEVRLQLQIHKFIWDPDAKGV
ncbi:MAG: 4Fe-4S cluster-binding domain-containing protein [Veillonella sp.]|nr:4Fe-4S cluster-binding domain-containing protein [Veillonella sp.]